MPAHKQSSLFIPFSHSLNMCLSLGSGTYNLSSSLYDDVMVHSLLHAFLQEPLLKYRLPAVACPPPLLLQITPVLPPESAGPKQAVLFVVQYCISPRLTGPLRDISMTLQVPKSLGQPSKVGSL